jgi:hypothetical protein
MENLKLKKLLKKLFEDKEFEMTLINTEHAYDGYNYVTEDIIYEFKFHVVVESVLGEGTMAVGNINIIIDSITKDGDDYYNNWVNRHYDDGAWYIDELHDKFHDEYFSHLPFNVHANFYGYDQERNEEDTILESVIKKIVRKLL